MLAGKRIVLGVGGGIAAYKAVEVSRRLVDAGAHVVPVMTQAAEHFIGRTTLSALASEPVRVDLWEGPDPIPHTRLGQTADLICVAPATARIISALAHGYSHDLLTNVLIASRAPVVLCPAMHTEMWEHPAVIDNMALLRSRGVHVVGPESGRLAGGDIGAGRMSDPEAIVAMIDSVLGVGDLAGVDLVVTAGGTREPIDAVRVLANRSSGRQGHAIAEEAARRGANVTLITTVELDAVGVSTRIQVETAAEMEAALMSVDQQADVIVMAAAVADFRPVAPVEHKIKKDAGPPVVALEPTPDLLAGLGQRRRAGQILVGFAAETNDLIENARGKLERKKIDLVVANDVSAPGVGFAHRTNAVSLVSAAGVREVPLADKRVIASAVLDEIARIRQTVR